MKPNFKLIYTSCCMKAGSLEKKTAFCGFFANDVIVDLIEQTLLLQFGWQTLQPY